MKSKANNRSNCYERKPKDKQSNAVGKRIAYLLVFCLLLTLSNHFGTFASNVSFSDITGKEWYAKDVLLLAENQNQIIKGFPDGSFQAQNQLGVDQFITMLVRAGGENVKNHNDYWALNFLHKAKEMGILKEGDFKDYKAPITREEMAVLMIRFLEKREDLSKVDISNSSKLILDYIMVGQYVSEQESKDLYRDSVKKAYKLGLLNGYEDARFMPQNILTRAEASTVIVRLLEPSRRVTINEESIKQKQVEEMKKHYYKGSKWVDPADNSIPKLKRALEDRLLTKSNMSYVPYIHMIIQEDDYPDLSVDDIRGTIKYDKNGPKEGHVEDFEQLLLRRLPQKDVDKVMRLLKTKTNSNTHLEYSKTDFFLNNNCYHVRLVENINLDNTAYSVSFNIWYFDETWKKNFKEYYDYNYRRVY